MDRPYGPKSRLIRALLYTYTNRIVYDEILLSYSVVNLAAAKRRGQSITMQAMFLYFGVCISVCGLRFTDLRHVAFSCNSKDFNSINCSGQNH